MTDQTPTDDSTTVSETADRTTRCDACGRRIDPTAWHPVATRFDDDGEFHLFAFCRAACRDAWRDD